MADELRPETASHTKIADRLKTVWLGFTCGLAELGAFANPTAAQLVRERQRQKLLAREYERQARLNWEEARRADTKAGRIPPSPRKP